MQMETLRDLYVEQLKDLYSAEKQLVKALPKMVKGASNAELKKAFSDHLTKTETHVERLERVFDLLGESPRGKKCRGMEGLIEEASELMAEDADEDVLDAGLIAKAQHVEHYEIAGYGTVRTYAERLGEDEQARLLQQTLDEEAEADQLLTQIAESSVNVEAAMGAEPDSRTSSRGERTVARGVAREGAQSRRPSVGAKRGTRTGATEKRAR